MKVGILGNGLTSLTLAKALVNEGVNVEIISDNKFKSTKKFQTVGITQSNVEFFNKTILDISKLSWQINKIEIFTEKSKNEKILNFDNNKKQLFSIFKNYQLYNLLNSSLKNSKFFKRKKKLSNHDYAIIINCDRNNSLTRKIFYKKIEKSYKSSAFVTSIKHKKNLSNNTAIQIFTNFGPIAFLPVSENETSIVYSLKKKKNLTKDQIINLIKSYNQKYIITKINEIKSFDLVSSSLRVYHHKNILAFGDLLHTIHPLAGQGFNMTIRDIKQLLKIIKSRLDLGLELDNSVCSDFEKKSKHKNYLFSSAIDFIYEFFNFESKTNNYKMSKAFKFLDKNQTLKKFITKFANNGIIN